MFTVFFYVGNIGTDGGAPDDIRLQILKRFRAEGIEIAYNKKDVYVHMRDVEQTETLARDSGARPQRRGNQRPST